MGAPRWVKERAREQSRREARAERRKANQQLVREIPDEDEGSDTSEAEQVN